MSGEGILVAIPCYKCEKQLPRVLKGFFDSASLLESVHEVVIIDNRSPDKTVEMAVAAVKSFGTSAKFKIIRNIANYGLGGSHKVALKYAIKKKFEYLAILHGDNQARTTELANLLLKAEQCPDLDAVLGSRFSEGSKLIGYDRRRILGNRALNILYTLLTGQRVYDLGSGLNLFKVDSMPLHIVELFADAFTFNMDMLLYLLKSGKTFTFEPITWTETDQVSNARNFDVAWQAFNQLLRWTWSPTWYSKKTILENKIYEWEEIL